MGMQYTPPKMNTRCDAITEIIKSVAKEQEALARILCAEGGKIEKFTSEEFHANRQELLDVNKSVNNMVKSITLLEFILQTKLELFEDCLCPEYGCDAD